MIFAVAMEAIAYYNTESLIMLSDPAYFNVPKSQIGRTSSDILFYATIASLFAAVLCGYCFDIFGRKIPIALSFFLLVVLIWILPNVSSIGVLILCRSGVQCAL